MKKALVLLLTVVMLLGTAVAEEVRTIFVVGFDFRTAEVILEDEDGFLWLCPFGKNNWTLGEEFELVLNEDSAEIRECE